VGEALFWLLVLGLTVACVSWTVTREEITREPREWLDHCANTSNSWLVRKLCYMLTCEYCFSHYVAAGVIALADFPLLFFDWRGYIFAWFTLVAVSNVMMSAYSRLRVEIRKNRADVQETEVRIKGRELAESFSVK
jgi:hypothetical protein